MTPRSTADDGTAFRDLDHDGRMAPYEDPRLAPAERADDLVRRLSLEEKAGLLFQSILGVGTPGDHDTVVGIAHETTREVVSDRLMNHFNLHALPSPAGTVRWQNEVQRLAEQTPHGMPVTFSSDPRHAFAENSGVAFAASSVSQWPEPLGLAAIGDADLVRRFADATRREYVALGLRAALHPQIDLATEPRWGRQAQTFGQDAALTSRLVTAYLDGMQGPSLGPASVACTTKHFPGGGPQADGEDPHFPYGSDQVYPGGRFDLHLEPFRAAIAAGTAGMMPYYGVPRGLEIDGEPVEEVAFGFNRRIVTGLLRDELGFDGVVCTDWGLVTDAVVFGKPFPARAWGVEHLSEEDRVLRIIEAGADQFGGETRTDLVLRLVRSGRLAESRLDESVRRLLRVKFELGLFDDPYLDEGAAVAAVGTADDRAAGHRAQAEAVTVLADDGVLPLAEGTRVLLDGATGAPGLEVVAGPDEADVAIVRLGAPFEPRDTYFLESFFHAGSLDFPAETVERVRALAARVPVVLVVHLDRPAILTPFAGRVAAIVGEFGASDAAVADALTGRIAPRGRLPFELPRDMDAVRASRPDVPSDTADPLFAHGHGLDLAASPRRSGEAG